MEKDKIKIPRFFGKNKIVKIKDPLLVVRNISKEYKGEELFRAAGLTVNSNDRIAIIGPNGIGKTTFLKIILGQEGEDDGNIIENKQLRMGYLPQETRWKLLKNTLLKEIHSVDIQESGQNNRYRYKGLIEELLKNFGFFENDWQREIKTLSGGEKTKLALAKILISNPNLLVLDEPTNHLDLETIEWLEGFLLSWNQAIICVSHDRYFLDKVCDKTFELTKNGFEKYYCSYSGYLTEKEKRFEGEEDRRKRQEKYLKKQQVFIDRFRANASKASQVKSRIKLLDKIDRIDDPTKSKEIKIDFSIERKTCANVLKISNLTVGKKEVPLFKVPGIMEVNWGDKIGIIGNNGAGKSTLLKGILGMNKSIEGKIKTGEGIRIGYYAQAHEELDPDKTILDEVSAETEFDEEKTRSILGRLLFTDNEVFKKIGCLSGGERARVALAELILQKSNLLLLDEPTNHLDLPSKEAVGNMLKEFKGTILLVSHDRYILNKACDIIWEIKNGELNKYLGNYDDYRCLKKGV